MTRISSFLIAPLTLLAVSFFGCSKDKTSSPTKPTAQFTVSTSSSVKGAALSFSNTSSNAANYLWKFGDGNGSVDSNPKHVYDSIGTFKVTLIAIGTGGSDSVSTTVTVKSNNITIFDGLGIKEIKLGATWASIEKIGYGSYGDSVYKTTATLYEHDVWFDQAGFACIFNTSSSVLTINDVVETIFIYEPYVGTCNKGIPIYGTKSNVLFYYGTTSYTKHWTNTSNGKTYNLSYYNYPALGIVFFVNEDAGVVYEMGIYSPSTTSKKSGTDFSTNRMLPFIK